MAGEERVTIAGSFPTPCIFPNEEMLLIDVPAETAVKIPEPIPVLQISYNLLPVNQKTPATKFYCRITDIFHIFMIQILLPDQPDDKRQ